MQLAKALTGRWIHSWEEDTEGSKAFRRIGFDFPLSRRPRQIIEMIDDGRVIIYSGGMTDARDVIREGRWNVTNSSRLIFRWERTGRQTVLGIVEQRENLLRLRCLDETVE